MHSESALDSHSHKTFTYQSMGTTWVITLWDNIPNEKFLTLQKTIVDRSTIFDHTYSRFIDGSLVWRLSERTGVQEVPHDLVTMLRMYRSLYTPSMHKFTPLIGNTLSDLGYDKDYSLTQKEHIRPTPDFLETVKILDDTHIELREQTLIDLGGLGKGYFVDRIAEYLRAEGIEEFLVNGSGDIAYQRAHGVIRAGLEDPQDHSKVIGVIELSGTGAFCASSGSRRTWGKYHHTIDPDTHSSPTDILATWVLAENAVLADALATCLFFIPEDNFRPAHDFESLIMKNGRSIKASSGFRAQIFQ